MIYILQSEPANTNTNMSLRILPSGITPDKDTTVGNDNIIGSVSQNSEFEHIWFTFTAF